MEKFIPTYSKELSIYEQETLRKIETFRAARKNWLLNNASENTSTEEKENLNESYVCNANFRFACLRRLKPPPTSCPLYKTLRPLKYYTLKPRTSGPDVEEKRRSKKQRVRQYELVTPTVVEAPKEKVIKTKHKDKDEYWKPRTQPCQEAISRLKAAHWQQGLIESCRCDDGREVTVVIKGICLCDKNTLNNIKLNKVCEKFGKVGVSPDELPMRKPEEEKEVKKDIGETPNDESKTSIEKLLEEKPSDMSTKFSSRILNTSLRAGENSEVAITSEGKTLKKVDFTDEDIKRKMQPRKFPNVNDSDLTVYKKLPSSRVSLENLSGSVKEPDSIGEFQFTEESVLGKESNKSPSEEKFTSETEGNVSNWSIKSFDLEKGDIRHPKKSSAVRDLTEPTSKPIALESKINLMDSLEKQLPHSPGKEKSHSLVKVNSEGISTSRVTVLDEKIRNIKHPQSKSTSTISLFKNYHQEPSTLGLTKEQMEVLKRNEKITVTDKG